MENIPSPPILNYQEMISFGITKREQEIELDHLLNKIINPLEKIINEISNTYRDLSDAIRDKIPGLILTKSNQYTQLFLEMIKIFGRVFRQLKILFDTNKDELIVLDRIFGVRISIDVVNINNKKLFSMLKDVNKEYRVDNYTKNLFFFLGTIEYLDDAIREIDILTDTFI
jgi:hypothetical protein